MKTLKTCTACKHYDNDCPDCLDYQQWESDIDNDEEARASILKQAESVINGERRDKYGNPEDSFKRIAGYWSVYLGVEINSRQVAEMMGLMKVARMQEQTYHQDNYVDCVGYFALAGRMGWV